MPNEDDWSLWSASPNLGPTELIAESPKSWIAVAELDILAPEGVAYGELLRKAGVEVGIKVYEGSTHSILALDGKFLSYGLIILLDLYSDTDSHRFIQGKLCETCHGCQVMTDIRFAAFSVLVNSLWRMRLRNLPWLSVLHRLFQTSNIHVLYRQNRQLYI